MRLSDILIVAIWLFLLAGALRTGLLVTTRAKFAPPAIVAPYLLAFFFVFSFAAAFFQRNLRWEGIFINKLVDRIWGTGTCDAFMRRFKPARLMMLFCLIVGIVGLITTHIGTQDYPAYFTSSFALAIGLGLLTAYLLSLKFPPTLL